MSNLNTSRPRQIFIAEFRQAGAAMAASVTTKDIDTPADRHPVKTFLRPATALMAGLLVLGSDLATAMTIKEFRKFSAQDQATYIGAAVSMLAYNYAADGDTAKAHCIKEWYFGQKGVETPGPREISIEMGVAENLDAAKYHVEGVVLGVAEKACSAGLSH